jgi:CHRD domain
LTSDKEAHVRKHAIIAAVAVAVFVTGATPIASGDDQHRGPTRFEARLEGFQENPSISTTGTGEFELRIDEDSQTMEFVLSYDNLEGVGTTPFVIDGVVTAAHIHVAARGVNGGVAPWLCGGGGKPACPTPSGTVTGVIVPSDILGPAGQGINPGEPTAFEELVKAIRAGFTYVNVHTTRWGGGEIRGQIRARGHKD